MIMLRNGEEPFFHPLTGQRIGPFEAYEGFAHTDNENEEIPDEPVKRKPRGKTKE